ncbi:hypothetical protein SERLA73DRAFT_149993 [Serpula lacrymans var. lacrymans S7.3]|uniref:Uncharacterized protein n=1 Tax=Serpula lacrymans var. lacrymans (strain S7.3) TaxID=936435 RepID=F8PKB8_SERL3|nr:hypothetical protein SERLA73DRAFT_149993 [Serpula lacrymans var. lacrymans S7.3]
MLNSPSSNPLPETLWKTILLYLKKTVVASAPVLTLIVTFSAPPSSLSLSSPPPLKLDVPSTIITLVQFLALFASFDIFRLSSSAILFTFTVSTSRQHSEEWVSEADHRHQRDFLAALNKPLPVLPVPTKARTPDAEGTVEQITELYQDSSALSSPIDPIEEIILDINNALALALTQSIFYHSTICRRNTRSLEEVLLNDYFESLVRLSYENTQRVKLLKGAVNVQEQNLHLILQDYIPSLLELYRIHPLSFPSIPSRLLPYNFEHTLPCGIVLRKKPKEEPTYNIPSSFSTNNYYNIYSTSPVHYQPIKYFCIGNHLDNLSIINYLMRLRCTLYLPQVEDLEAFGPCFGLQHSTSVIIVTPATKDQIRQVVAGLAQFDQLIATAQRKARDGEDYTADIDNIQYVSKYVEKYYWVLEILTPFIVNQRSDYPEHFIITVSKVTSGPLLIIVQKLISTRNPRPPTKVKEEKHHLSHQSSNFLHLAQK